MKEKWETHKARLPHQIEYARKVAIRQYMSSDEFKKMIGRLTGPFLINGFRMGTTQVREMLEDDDELVEELEEIQFDPDVKIKVERIPKVVNDEPTCGQKSMMWTP
ncbi:hypothetical protein Dimus_012973 [Dionaea muscipula]